MLPLLDFYSQPFDGTQIIGVAGYSEDCGVTSHATALATYAANLGKTAILQSDHADDATLPFLQFICQQLGLDVPVIDFVNDVSIDEYDYVIIDKVNPNASITPDLIQYITPPALKDRSLGITDPAHDKFCGKVSRAFAAAFPDAVVEFITEGQVKQSTAQNLLTGTDWMVIRELEQMFLAGTDLSNLREYLRSHDIRNWRSGQQITA